ncbi:flagellar protein FlaG [Clostridium kluyveri]|uniref:flagellar protein FlaG n=1 Tax=Clostridium kluyveri TaxID=1534 RepID=UPI00224590B7|nr:flagellar protein FlaG [Clostridium kluyveri]UZQ50514.1 flagellar protein FlaG [Clostridium kluyveri]
MEVRDIGQGRQVSFDTSNNGGSTEISTDVVSVNDNTANIGTGDKNIESKDTKKAVDKLNKLLEDTPTHLEYEVYGRLNGIMIKVVDDNTKEVVKEIPPKKIVDMVDKLCELAGLFMDKKV